MIHQVYFINLDYFYIIIKGKVNCTEPYKLPVVLGENNYFGEDLIIFRGVETKKYKCASPVKCYRLDAQHFTDIIQPLLYSLDDLVETEIIGLGGFALVKKVHPKDKPQFFYSLKIVHKSKIRTEADKRNMINEKKISLTLNHPFLVRLVTTYQTKECLYFLQEYVPGGDLRMLMTSRKNCRLSEPETKFYTSCLVIVLHYFQENHLVYRDLKPENILLTKNGYIKVSDFSNTKIANPKTYTLCGTPDYMAPEIWLNKGHDYSVDLWALGILIYELINGNTPFDMHDGSNVYLN